MVVAQGVSTISPLALGCGRQGAWASRYAAADGAALHTLKHEHTLSHTQIQTHTHTHPNIHTQDFRGGQYTADSSSGVQPGCRPTRLMEWRLLGSCGLQVLLD